MTVLRYITCYCLLIIPIHCLEAQSYCQQNYKFLFGDKETKSFWIGLNLYGDECEESIAIELRVDNHQVEIIEHEVESFDNWDEILAKKNASSLDYAVELSSSSRSWEYPIVQLKLKEPSYSAKLMNFYLEELNSVCGKGWNNAMGVKGMVLPKVTAIKTPHLIYSNPNGLYFNYQIAQAYYFPDSEYLLVFTLQETRCDGGGSMHGFFLFKFQ